MRTPACLTCLTLLALPLQAWARPISRVLDLAVGAEQFFHLDSSAVVVDDPAVATAEQLPAEEVLVTTKAAGRALVLVWVSNAIEAVRLRIHEKGSQPPALPASEAQLLATKKSCPGMRISAEGGKRALEVSVDSPSCRDSLRALFASDDFLAGDLSLNFSHEMMQVQLSAIVAELKKRGVSGFALSYQGVALVVRGKATLEQKRELMKVAFDQSLGRVLVDDQSELVASAPAPDGGLQSPGSPRTQP